MCILRFFQSKKNIYIWNINRNKCDEGRKKYDELGRWLSFVTRRWRIMRINTYWKVHTWRGNVPKFEFPSNFPLNCQSEADSRWEHNEMRKFLSGNFRRRSIMCVRVFLTFFQCVLWAWHIVEYQVRSVKFFIRRDVFNIAFFFSLRRLSMLSQL